MSVLVPFHNGYKDTIRNWISSKINPGDSILDLGAGDGAVLLHLRTKIHINPIASDISECKLNENRNLTGAGSKGFPLRSTLSPLGKMKIAVIPVDFANASGVGNPGEMFADDLVLIKDWADY